MKTVHKVCYWIRKHEAVSREPDANGTVAVRCDQCPALETINGRYRGTRMCRLMAQELIDVVKYGNPWGKKYQRTRRSWPDRKKYTGTGKVK